MMTDVDVLNLLLTSNRRIIWNGAYVASVGYSVNHHLRWANSERPRLQKILENLASTYEFIVKDSYEGCYRVDRKKLFQMWQTERALNVTKPEPAYTELLEAAGMI